MANQAPTVPSMARELAVQFQKNKKSFLGKLDDYDKAGGDNALAEHLWMHIGERGALFNHFHELKLEEMGEKAFADAGGGTAEFF